MSQISPKIWGGVINLLWPRGQDPGPWQGLTGPYLWKTLGHFRGPRITRLLFVEYVGPKGTGGPIGAPLVHHEKCLIAFRVLQTNNCATFLGLISATPHTPPPNKRSVELMYNVYRSLYIYSLFFCSNIFLLILLLKV